MSKKILKSLIGVFAISSVIGVGSISVGAADGVTFFTDSDFKGKAVVLGLGSYTLDQLEVRGISNDQISSISIPVGYAVTVYQHDNFSGDYWKFLSSPSNLYGYGCNDTMTSVVISRPTEPNGVTFYSDSYYRRNDVVLSAGSYTLSQLEVLGISNDDISSIIIPAGYTVKIFQHNYWGGNYWTFKSNVGNLRDHGCNDTMSSVIITKN